MRGCTARWLAVGPTMLLLLHSWLSAGVPDAASMEPCSCCLHSLYDGRRWQPPCCLSPLAAALFAVQHVEKAAAT